MNRATYDKLRALVDRPDGGKTTLTPAEAKTVLDDLTLFWAREREPQAMHSVQLVRELISIRDGVEPVDIVVGPLS